MKNIINTIFGMVMLLSMFSCENNESIIVSDIPVFVEQGSFDSPELGMTFKILSENEEWQVGYNKIYIKTEPYLNNPVEEVKILLFPEMTMQMEMGQMKHGCPFENPEYYSETQYYEGAVVFVMPSSAGTWEISLNISTLDGSSSDELEFSVDVISPEESKMIIFKHDEKNYFVSLVQPVAPKVGINDFELTVHRRDGMYSWPAVDDLTIEVTPEMPSMGHGSPNNEDPVSTQIGHYQGKVNFTMDGYWKLNMVVKDGDNLMADDISFDMTFSSSSNQ